MPNLPRDQHLDPEGLALFLNTLETNVMSAEYSSSATYAVGAYCVYNNKIYRCTTAITSGETWNASHWTSVLLTDEIKSKGTVNSVKIGNTEYTPASGVVTLPNASIKIDDTIVLGKNDNTSLYILSGDNVEITPESAVISRMTISVNAKSRPIQLNGTEILGNNTTPFNLVEGPGVFLSNSGGSVTISSYGTDVVSQKTTDDNNSYRVLFSGTADDVDVASITRKNSTLTFNPYTGDLSAPSMYNQMFTTTNANGNIRIRSWVGGNDDGVLDVYDTNNVCTVSLSGATGKLTARYAEFNATDSSISFAGSNATYPMIRFIDNTGDVNGNGIAIGGGGQSIIGGGESASVMIAQAGTSGSEIMYIGNDSDVYIFTNLQTGWDARKSFRFTYEGDLVISGQVERPGGNTSWIKGRDVAPVKTTSGGGAWNPVVSAKSVNGDWCIGTLSDNLYISYGTDTNYNNNTNTTVTRYFNTSGDFSGNAANVTGTVAIDHGGTGATSKTAAGTNLGFNWSGQSGQPTWLWGGNAHGTYYVYNPSNFSVNTAAYSTLHQASGSTTGSTAKAFTVPAAATEVMITAQFSSKIFSASIPKALLTTSNQEIWLTGGKSNNTGAVGGAARCICNVKISSTTLTLQGVAANDEGTDRLSSVTWKVFYK